MSQSSASPQFGRQSLDIRDVVKDSMYREAWGLSVKTANKDELEDCAVKNKDSPTPPQLSKSVDGSSSLGINGKQNLPADLREPLRVLAKLREAPWYFNESGERSRSSCESNNGSMFSVLKDAPRFSCDGRELNRLSFESQETLKSTLKLKELPRLSLDSRDAKLMGLETLPDDSLARDSQIGSIKTFPVEDCDPLSRWEPVFSEASSEASKMSSRATNSFPSVYSEIEKRLTDLEFTQSGKDLGALKLILEAIQAKGFLETRREEQYSNLATKKDYEPRHTSSHLSARLVNQQKPHSDRVNRSTSKGDNSLRTFESPIVIMKLAKLFENSGVPASSVIPMDRLSGLPKLKSDDGTTNSNDNSNRVQLDSADNLTFNSMASGLKSEINHKKLENIEHLVQKLRRLNSNNDETHTDYIASLYEKTNPDHRYISEILLASGLLLRDLNSITTTFQLHPSGHPVNPELFLVLEQTKASTRLKEESNIENVVLMKNDKEKFHRKLLFDAVNEILVGKLASMGFFPEPWLRPRNQQENL
ncbi:Protein LONGIFOLIA 1 [Camellia lanceoleosa]|uniref:Protein LONGIFOLIA 1 n=1 Tax=Camellia lanceoleosa TaxID=1840588 RepID=A0ACC0FBC3_9ERIC|nr:Protein LONGIFOLIA 1 [Camellia lanceoleosa]